MTDATALQVRQADRRTALLAPQQSSPPWLTSLLTCMGEVDGRPVLHAGAALTEAQRTVVTTMESRLSAHLSPAAASDIGKGIAILRVAFPAAAVGEGEAAAIARAYMLALDGVPGFALEEAVRRILANEAGLKPRYMPTPPELRGVVDEVSRPARWHLVQLRRLLKAEAERPFERGGRRELPQSVTDFLGSIPSRRRGQPNPSGVNHAAKDHL